MIGRNSRLGIAASPALASVALNGVAEAQTTADRPPVAPIKASTIVLVGDSTTQVFSGSGGSFCATHVTSALACVNLARGGRSTYSCRAQGSWARALAEMGTRGGTVKLAGIWLVGSR